MSAVLGVDPTVTRELQPKSPPSPSATAKSYIAHQGLELDELSPAAVAFEHMPPGPHATDSVPEPHRGTHLRRGSPPPESKSHPRSRSAHGQVVVEDESWSPTPERPSSGSPINFMLSPPPRAVTPPDATGLPQFSLPAAHPVPRSAPPLPPGNSDSVSPVSRPAQPFASPAHAAVSPIPSSLPVMSVPSPQGSDVSRDKWDGDAPSPPRVLVQPKSNLSDTTPTGYRGKDPLHSASVVTVGSASGDSNGGSAEGSNSSSGRSSTAGWSSGSTPESASLSPVLATPESVASSAASPASQPFRHSPPELPPFRQPSLASLDAAGAQAAGERSDADRAWAWAAAAASAASAGLAVPPVPAPDPPPGQGHEDDAAAASSDSRPSAVVPVQAPAIAAVANTIGAVRSSYGRAGVAETGSLRPVAFAAGGGSSSPAVPSPAGLLPDYTGAALHAGSVAAAVPPAGSAAGADERRQAAAMRLEASTLEARLGLLRASIQEAEAKMQGIADASARAEREIKLRKSIDARRAEAEAVAAQLRTELAELESARIVADRAASENAEIANQWKERSDAFEAAYDKQKAEHSEMRSQIEALKAQLAAAATSPREAPATSAAQFAATAATIDRLRSDHAAELATSREAAAARVAEIAAAFAAVDKLRIESQAEAKEARATAAALQAKLDELSSATSGVTEAAAEATVHRARASTASGLCVMLARRLIDVTCIAAAYAEVAASALSSDSSGGASQNDTHARQVDALFSRARASAAALEPTLSVVEASTDASDALLGAPPSLSASGAPMGNASIEAVQSLAASVQDLAAASAVHDLLLSSIRSALQDAKASATQRASSDRVIEGRISAAIAAARTAAETELAAAAAAHATALAEQRKESEATLESRTALVAEWEAYANHWEERGREAERLTKEWEKCFDELQAQHEQVVADAAITAASAEAATRAAAAATADRDRLQSEIGSLRQYLLRGGAPPSFSALSAGSASPPSLGFPASVGPGTSLLLAPTGSRLSQQLTAESGAPAQAPSAGYPSAPSGQPSASGRSAGGSAAVKVVQIVKRPSAAATTASAAAAAVPPFSSSAIHSNDPQPSPPDLESPAPPVTSSFAYAQPVVVASAAPYPMSTERQQAAALAAAAAAAAPLGQPYYGPGSQPWSQATPQASQAVQYSHQLYSQPAFAPSTPPLLSPQQQQQQASAVPLYSSGPPSLYNASPFLGSAGAGGGVRGRGGPGSPGSASASAAAAGPLSPSAPTYPRGAGRPDPHAQSQRWTVTLGAPTGTGTPHTAAAGAAASAAPPVAPTATASGTSSS